VTVELMPADELGDLVERIARRVVELLDEREANFQRVENFARLVDSATLARMLGVSRAYVYEHALELGGVQLGDGDRPRLRFDVEKALERWTARETRSESQPPDPPAPADVVRRRRRRATRPGDGLLPVRGEAA
jgi:hypothetical protein